MASGKRTPLADLVTAGLVLAGGQARRMAGADKPLMLLGGKPLITHALARLQAPGRPCAISANGNVARFAPLGLPVLPDADASFSGPLAGVLAGLTWAAGMGAKALLTVPADCPFLPFDIAQRLAQASNGQSIAYARAGGRDHPTVALWPMAARAPLAEWLARGERRVMGFLAAFGACPVDWPDAQAFMNINTPADLAAAQALLDQPPNT